MQSSTWPHRRTALFAVVVAGIVAVWGAGHVAGVGVDEISVPEIVPNVTASVPQVSFDGPTIGNESSHGTPTPGISPLPSIPVDNGDSEKSPSSVLRGVEQSA